MKRIIKFIPNIITSMNLLFGCMAIVMTFKGDLETAFYYMLLSAIFDFCDGLAAKLLNAYSKMGKELDSLADVVSFGVLPSCVMYAMGGGYYSFIIAIFSALRLAKFNTDTRQTTEFIGLPTPANALLFCSIGYISQSNPEAWITSVFTSQNFIYPAIIIFSLLLVSEIPMFALKFRSFKLSKNIKVYSFILLSIGAVALFHALAIPFIIIGYILLSMAEWLYSLIFSREQLNH